MIVTVAEVPVVPPPAGCYAYAHVYTKVQVQSSIVLSG